MFFSCICFKYVQEIVIPPNASYVIISSDHKSAANTLRLPLPLHSAEGQLLVIANADESGTAGDMHIPSGATALLVFDGVKWISVDSLRVNAERLTGVTELRASADLYIGNHTFSAAAFKFSNDVNVPKFALLYQNNAGNIVANPKLGFSRGILSAPALSVESLESDIDAKKHIIR
jgi:hypothetical protein